MPRFVVLRHECPPEYGRPSHWDFMLQRGPEADALLRTWALWESPDHTREQAAEALADHRREYLAYEGAVSGGRGTVSRWDEGTFEFLPDSSGASAAELRIRVCGRRLQGTVRLVAADGPNWRYGYTPT